ncbi:MAG: AAA family ATPase [Gemmatimonadota bacterium]
MNEAFAMRVASAVGRRVVGQEVLVRRLLVALLAQGHVLLEGVPGLAKTLIVRSLAASLDVDFRRIQFTPDILPSDVVGTLVFRPDRGVFVVSRGPVFANIILVDELNRAPAKVQSALLEAMEERQVTLGGRTMTLPEPFMVLATENPVEQQGTYPLAEAQLDRFMMLLRVDYPSRDDEHRILEAAVGGQRQPIHPVATCADLMDVRRAVGEVKVAATLSRYVVDLVRATRDPASVGLPELEGTVQLGGSPRAGVNLLAAARANAFLENRAFVLPEDVKELAGDVLSHRILLTYEAAARGIDSRDVVESILAAVPVP